MFINFFVAINIHLFIYFFCIFFYFIYLKFLIDWDEREKIADPEAQKPEDWDESAPRQVLTLNINLIKYCTGT